MENLICGLIIFSAVFLINLLMNTKKIKKKKYDKIIEIGYLEKKFKLKVKDLNLKKLKYIFSLIHAFIISITVVLVSLIKLHYFIQLLIGFFVLILLIFACYEILGNVIVRKKEKNECL